MNGNMGFTICMQVLLIVSFLSADGQKEISNKLFRIYEDNDFINVRGKGTDKAYSGGTRFDLYYEQQKRPLLFPGFVNPKHDTALYGGEWGLMQTIFTPNNISDPYFEQYDYFYSGALFFIRSLYSVNMVRKYSFHVDLLLGVRGPAAMGKQTQTMVHRAIHYTLPLGWDNQLRNSPIFNIDLGFEKEVAGTKVIEVMAGAKSYFGTLLTGLSFYPFVRFGIMHPYFNSYINQFSTAGSSIRGKHNKLQAYIVVKPQVQWLLNNSLIETGLFAKKPRLKTDDRISSARGEQQLLYSECIIRHWVFGADYGGVLAFGKFAISFTQNISSELRKGTYSHEVGNISLYFIL